MLHSHSSLEDDETAFGSRKEVQIYVPMSERGAKYMVGTIKRAVIETTRNDEDQKVRAVLFVLYGYR